MEITNTDILSLGECTFRKGTLLCRQKVHHQDAGVFYRHHFVVFGWTIFRQIVTIRIGINCNLFLTDMCWYSCEAKFIQNLPSTSKLPSSQFKFTSRYIHNAFHLQTNTAPSVWRLITRCHFLPMNPNRGANRERRTLSSWIHAPIFRRSWNLTWTLHYRQKCDDFKYTKG